MVIDGKVNGDTFTVWVEKFLTPTPAPGNAGIADNLSNHRVPLALKLIVNVRAELLILPPYSSNLNPIQMGLAKLKTLFCNAVPVPWKGCLQESKPSSTYSHGPSEWADYSSDLPTREQFQIGLKHDELALCILDPIV